MNSILVTGGTGSFGQAFCKRMIAVGMKRIIVYSRDEHKQYEMSQAIDDPNDQMRFFIGDVRDFSRLRRAMRNVDVVIHAAALKRIEAGFYNPIEFKKTNVDGTCNVIEACMDAGVKRAVLLSSDKAYQPVSIYGQSKAMAESLFLGADKMTGLEHPHFSVTRYGNVWESKGSVVPKWKEIVRDTIPHGYTAKVPVTDPDCTRFYMTMNQAIDLVMKAVRADGGQLHIPILPAYRLGDLAEAMGAEMNITGLPEFEKLHEGMCDGNTSVTARRMSVDELRDAL